MRKLCSLIILSGGILCGEQLLKLPSGGEILVRKEGNKLVDCRGKTVSAKGSLVPTDDRCPDQMLAAMALPRTAGNLTAVMLAGASLTGAGLILLFIDRRKARS